MLDDITPDGIFTWTCPHCFTKRSAHISHKQLRYSEIDNKHVILPMCPCGSQTGLNVVFPEHAIRPPVITRGEHPITGKEGILGVDLPPGSLYSKIVHVEEHIVNGEAVYIDIVDGVQFHRAVAPHQELHRQLQQAGKAPPA